MKRNCLYLAFLTMVLLQFSCKDHTLEEFKVDKNIPVTVSAGAMIGKVTRDNEKATMKLAIGLSASAKKAFQINLVLNADTVNQLIAQNVLENTVLLPAPYIKMINVIDVAYGVDSAFFSVDISLTAFERFFGKKVAFAISLDDPTKGNQASTVKRTMLVVLDTRDVIKEEEIHYLSITNGGGGILSLTKGVNYKVTSAGVTIPLNIDLAGIVGGAFKITTRINNDTIAQLVTEGKLPENTVVIPEGKYYLSESINFPANKSKNDFVLTIPWNTLDLYMNTDISVPIALSISLETSTKHVLHPTKKNVIVLVNQSVNLDNNAFVIGNGTGLKAEYFKGQVLDKEGASPFNVRIDPNINFPGGWPNINGDGGRPAGEEDNWSSRWTGEFMAPVRGEYTFYQTRWDDGARLFINGVTIVDDFTDKWDLPGRFGKIYLERGERYKIEAHHRENVGGQQAVLEYECTSAGLNRTVVPKSQLFPAP